MTEDGQMLWLLKTLCKEGVVILKNASSEMGILTKFVEKIAFPRITHYGYVQHVRMYVCRVRNLKERDFKMST